ncbi:YbaN family protein [Thalassotalea ponticola]|uniref:YbaN family protein n=1 Tax=Thalassotalea ponticola TaxID=1523392 RepID=UPI0025B56EA1|nr:YbaN family protein [Thalassotalea ponticola]MDN3653755.1 YbaN family protein [Thalassotalea ponticola]
MRRYLYMAVGWGFVVLAVLGVILPVLPTTPFLLVAGACFARSSRTCHQWLLNNKLFGPLIDNWQNNRCIERKSKYIALLSIVLFGGTSLVFAVPWGYAKLAVLILLVIGFYVVYSLPTCPSHQEKKNW